MNELLAEFARWLAASEARETATHLLRTVPGLPPILQTVHLLSVAAVMASIVFINLRMLRIALPSQSLHEMLGRLIPWTVSAMMTLFVSALPFVLARPGRYMTNPVFQIKFALLVPALILLILIYLQERRVPHYWENRRVPAMLVGAGSLILWIGIVMAGRWIAYSDYLFWPG
jgi:hypothetical protein